MDDEEYDPERCIACDVDVEAWTEEFQAKAPDHLVAFVQVGQCPHDVDQPTNAVPVVTFEAHVVKNIVVLPGQEQSSWWEEFAIPEGDVDLGEVAQSIVDNFNATLHAGESARRVDDVRLIVGTYA